MIKGTSGCFEDKFSEININKSPTRKKKVYPSSLYSYDTNKENEGRNNLNIIPKDDKLDVRNMSYPLIEKSNSISDFQFSFMKETSSSLQKKSTTSTMKKSQSTRNFSRQKRLVSNTAQEDVSRRVLTNPNVDRRVLSKNNGDIRSEMTKNGDMISRRNQDGSSNVETMKNSPIITRNICQDMPTQGTKNVSEKITNQGIRYASHDMTRIRDSSRKVSRDITRNVSQSSPNNVFSRLYAPKRIDHPKDTAKRIKQRTYSHSKRFSNPSPVKIDRLTELFSILYEKDSSLFQLSTNDDAMIVNDTIKPDDLNLSSLNVYERGEIIRMKHLYYIPTSPRSVNINEKNFGFDDSKGNYNIINHDHINYRYETLNILGNGSFGTVIMSKDHKFANLCAIKIIKNDINWSLQSIKEIKMLKLLNTSNQNKNILNYYDHFNFRGHMCIVTELLSINLYSLLELVTFKGLSLSIIKNISLQILNGLQFMHSSNIIHCDIKPENIMIKLPPDRNPDDFVVKLIDFGTSCFANEIAHTYIQSRFYRAPEVILGASYNEKIDIWSFGCVVCELFTGVPLLPGKSELEQIGLILELFGAPKSTSILKYRNNLTKSLQKLKNQELGNVSNIQAVNDKQIKKTLLYKIFDMNGKINLGLLNNYINMNTNSSTTIKKQYKLSSKSIDFCLKIGNDEESKVFMNFLHRIFVWDSSERASVTRLLQDPFLD